LSTRPPTFDLEMSKEVDYRIDRRHRILDYVNHPSFVVGTFTRGVFCWRDRSNIQSIKAPANINPPK